MAYWLVKTEPNDFSYDDLERIGREPWDGVHNNAALKHMRDMHPGDLALFYHTGKERRVVGVCEVVSESYPDPKEDNERWIVVDVLPRYRFKEPVTLAQIKADPAFADWELVRISRLSVMPTPEPLWRRVHELGDTHPASST